MTVSPEYFLVYLLVIHFICSLTNFINSLGYPKEDRAFIISLGVIPILSQFFSIISLYKILKRFILSKGRCGLGHNFILQKEKGRTYEPGAYKVYSCKKCNYESVVSWPTPDEIRDKWGWETSN